ncbi:Crp/Fnr family transcriptional regulator [Kutzneria kofuensis]|uniref:Crp/Fnr family transcriptional regulator n=1 Tax=Kutzneria kofuensis TaxID=103725 RepID=UPI0031E97D60
MLAVCGPGEVLGELSAIDGRPRSATMTAIDAVDVLSLPAVRLQGLCDAHPRIAWSLLEVIAQRLRETDQQRAEYGGGSTMQRVVTLLLDLANRLGKAGVDGVHIASPFTQQELAETASTSRESMARVLRELRERGRDHDRAGSVRDTPDGEVAGIGAVRGCVCWGPILCGASERWHSRLSRAGGALSFCGSGRD